jgi:autotransporter-associated beta strand protein
MKLSRQRKLISRACLMAAASLLAAVPTARAANVFFDPNGGTTAAVTGQTIGTGGTANWDATLNYWVNAGAGTTIPGNAVGAAYTFTNADTAYFIGQSGTATLTLGVTLNGLYDSTQGMTIAGAQPLTLAGSTPTITNTGSAVTTISSNLAGTVGLTKAGTGILALSGTNTISGTINLQQGVISLNSATALGTSSLTIGGSGYAVGLDGAGTTLTSTGGITIGGDFTFIGTNSLNTGTGAVGLAANRTVQIGMNAQTTGALTIGGIISGAGALTKTGPGALTLSGANSFTGGTILNVGSLTLSGANTTSGATSVNGGRLFLGNAAALGTGALNLNGGLIDAVTAAQTLTSTGAINITGDFVYGGNLSLTTAAGANIVVSANSTIKTYGTGATTSLTLGGVISGSGFGLTKTGNGSLILTNANTYDGGTTLVAGD